MPHVLGLAVRPSTSTHAGMNATWVVQVNDPCR
jgi:hypothetical protein